MGVPRATSAAIIGIEPPERIVSGATPVARSMAAAPAQQDRVVRRHQSRCAGSARRSAPDRRAPGRPSRSSRSSSDAHRLRVLAGRQPQRQRRQREGADRGLVQRGVARGDRVHRQRVAGYRCGGRTRPPRWRRSAARRRRPASRRPSEASSSRRARCRWAATRRRPGCPAVPITADSTEIRSRTASAATPPYSPECSSLSADVILSWKPITPSQAVGDRRRLRVGHPAVEDDGRVESLLDRLQVVEHRVAADLLLTVGQDAHVDGQVPLGGEVEGASHQRVEVALVVRGAARVEPPVAHLRLKRIALPEVVRSRRLDVVVAVGDDRRRSVGARRDQTVDDRVPVALDDPGIADQPGDPVGGLAQLRRVLPVARDRADTEELEQLLQPVPVSGRPRAPGRPRCRSA